MRYLSIDIESTGLEEDSLIIEFAAVPFDSTTGEIREDLAMSFLIQCPDFNTLEPTLNDFVKENNKELIQEAFVYGLTKDEVKTEIVNYLENEDIKNYFGGNKIVLFGKSLSSIDLPFLSRDLGFDFMKNNFDFSKKAGGNA